MERLKNFLNSPTFDYVLIAAAIAIGFAAGWSNTRIAALVLIVWLILRPLKPNQLATVGLFALLLAVVAALIRQGERGEFLLFFSYLFLLLACINEMVNAWKTR